FREPGPVVVAGSIPLGDLALQDLVERRYVKQRATSQGAARVCLDAVDERNPLFLELRLPTHASASRAASAIARLSISILVTSRSASITAAVASWTATDGSWQTSVDAAAARSSSTTSR